MNVLFDLEGTLTDPGVGITRCLQHARGRLGREVSTTSARRRFVGPPLTWVVGDRVHDVRGARANGVKCIGVLWGYGSAGELRQAAPDHLVSSMRELCDVVEAEGR